MNPFFCYVVIVWQYKASRQYKASIFSTTDNDTYVGLSTVFSQVFINDMTRYNDDDSMMSA